MAFPHFVNASPIPNPTIPHANTFGQSFPISQLSLYIVASLLQRISRHVFAVACGFASSWRKYYNSRYGSCRFSFSRDHFNRTVYFTRSLVLLYVCVWCVCEVCVWCVCDDQVGKSESACFDILGFCFRKKFELSWDSCKCSD